jgi:uncharacterized protein (DUF2236 family)
MAATTDSDQDSEAAADGRTGPGAAWAAARLRGRVAAAASGLFSHGPYPLARTLDYPGDPGLYGPGSMTWPVIGDVAVFVGGIRALLVQAAHPEVAAGVSDHSRYRQDPLGRLTRTAAYVTATSFGALPEVEAAVGVVRRRHRPVHGSSGRDQPYDAAEPGLAAWVHNSLTDSFLAAYRAYGARPCPEADADRFVAEQRQTGALLGADPMPDTAAGLARWISAHPALGPSEAGREAVTFLRHPPLPAPVRAAYGALFRAAVATLPGRIADIAGVHDRAGDAALGRAATAALRWALGSSPDWQLALLRTGAAPPSGARFRQPLPPAARPADRPPEPADCPAL